ncbi:MAG: ATP-binding protein [Methylocystis sp.]
MKKKDITACLLRLTEAVERLAPPLACKPDFSSAEAFIWRRSSQGFHPVVRINRVELALLKGIQQQSDILFNNTQRFAQGLSANNALLWGAKGMGKSSLIKAVHGSLSDVGALKLIEIHREDIDALPDLLFTLSQAPFRFIVFCDDLSFEGSETSYKALKTALDGGVEGRPTNVIFYATTNRRHLIARNIMENENATAINPNEVIDEKVSLSDRFGLWIGFHNCSQDDYLLMVFSYVNHYKLNVSSEHVRSEALEWSVTRGARSGRVAWQFICDLAGRLGQSV